MAPRKIISDLPQKVAKKRGPKVKTVKAPRKTPSDIRIKIGNAGSKPEKITRRVTTQRKIELANEVALAQLQNKSFISPNGPTSPAKVVQVPERSVNSSVVAKKPALNHKKATAKVDIEDSEQNCSQPKEPLKPNQTEKYPANKYKRKLAIHTSEDETNTATNGFKSPPKKRFIKNCTTDNESGCDSSQERIKRKPGPKTQSACQVKKIIHNCITDNESDFDSSHEHIKKRPGPKTQYGNQVKKKTVAKQAPNSLSNGSLGVNMSESPLPKPKGPGRKRQQKVISDFFSHNPTNEEDEPEETTTTPAKKIIRKKQTKKPPSTETKGQKNLPAQTVAKARGRPRTKFPSERSVKTSAKGKCLNAKEIKLAVTALENALNNENARTASRHNSTNSIHSNLSWTKDVSTASSLSSGTTTCVTVSSNDRVRFDNKLPFVKLENTNYEQLKSIKSIEENTLQDMESSSSDSDSESDSSSDSESDLTDSIPDVNLSTSSLTPKSPRPDIAQDNTELLFLEMNTLTNSLKNFYTEMSKWIACDEDDSCTFSAILETMNLEKDVLNNCENFKSILDAVKSASEKTSPANLSPEKNETYHEPNQNDEPDDGKFRSSRNSSPETNSNINREKAAQNDSDGEFVKPVHIQSAPLKKRDSQPKFPVKIAITALSEVPNPPKEVPPDKTWEYIETHADDNNYDDEDALSLYAESITGVESSRRDSIASNVSSHDVYIPKPKSRSWMQEKYTYQPTRIEPELATRREDPVRMDEPQANPANMITRSFASTSQKEIDTNKIDASRLLDDASRLTSLADASIKRRLFDHYQAMNAVKSSLYKGHCFFHIANQCKNINCRFPHSDIDINLLKCRLATLTEDNLIEEYLLTRYYKTLGRKFGLHFVNECKRRKATRILMEMAIDLGLGVVACEDSLSVNVLEATLLHLNSISLDACDDQLRYEHNNVMMCDALLSCMANSQNFAQFKRAFAKLANFMWEINRPVDIEVVGSILERVCILPGEDSIARGMLSLMKNTDERIFESSMIATFEVQLSIIESDVHDVYLTAKRRALKVLMAQPGGMVEASPAPAQNPMTMSRMDRHTSPDSTNLDHLQTTEVAEPTFKCTIDTEAIRDLFKSPKSPAPKQRYAPRGQWRRGHGFNMRGPMRGHMRGRGNNHMVGRQVFSTQINRRNGAQT